MPTKTKKFAEPKMSRGEREILAWLSTRRRRWSRFTLKQIAEGVCMSNGGARAALDRLEDKMLVNSTERIGRQAMTFWVRLEDVAIGRF